MRGGFARLCVAALVAAGLPGCARQEAVSFPDTPAAPTSQTSSANSRAALLEVGRHVGFQFSDTGAVLAHRHLTVIQAPQAATVTGRRVVPTHAGYYLHLDAGHLAGYEVRESPLAHLTGIAGNTRFDVPKVVTFRAGRYLGYRFGAGGRLGDTRYARVAELGTADATRRAVIDGRAYVRVSEGAWAGYWMPVTRPRGLRAQRITCAVPVKPPAGSSAVLTRVATEEPEIALTFDMGGRLDPAVAIMERLIVDRVCATINPSGTMAQTTTGGAVMALIAAHPELFEVGNHTMHHCHLRDGGEGPSCPAEPPTSQRIKAELNQAEAVIRDLTGLEAEPYWRPPFGEYDADVLAVASAIGYTKALMWDVDTIDWLPTDQGGPTALSMVDKVVEDSTTGSIVLMHLGGYHTFDALPSMVLRLRAGGHVPTTISDLLG